MNVRAAFVYACLIVAFSLICASCGSEIGGVVIEETASPDGTKFIQVVEFNRGATDRGHTEIVFASDERRQRETIFRCRDITAVSVRWLHDGSVIIETPCCRAPILMDRLGVQIQIR